MTFENLFQQYYPYVVKHILKTVKEQDIAEDLAQEVFIQLYKTNWEEIEHLKAWLIKSAVYAAYNYIRSEKRHQARVEKATLLAELSDGQNLEDKWVRKEEIAQVRYAMEDLQEQDKKLLMLRYSGLKYKEIAALLQVETAAVGTMLVRAQNKFRKCYMNRMEVKR
ncbi:MAG: RNA polymerase sigma factor SigX [Cellulosilyticaceae bacterium]